MANESAADLQSDGQIEDAFESVFQSRSRGTHADDMLSDAAADIVQFAAPNELLTTYRARVADYLAAMITELDNIDRLAPAFAEAFGEDVEMPDRTGPTRYMVLWSGGYDAPQMSTTFHLHEAWLLLENWKQDASREDTLQILDLSGPTPAVVAEAQLDEHANV